MGFVLDWILLVGGYGWCVELLLLHFCFCVR